MWLYLPRACFESSASSLAAADSTSEFTSQPGAERGLWCTSSGTPMQRPASWPGWRRRPWHRLLSGTTLSASAAARGVEWWIASLSGVPVRTSASPEDRPGFAVAGVGSFSRGSASPTSARLRSFSGKTSEAHLALSPTYSPPSRATVTPAAQSAFVLLTWVPLTDGDEFLCWPSAGVPTSRNSGRGTSAMRAWGTPRASEGKGTGAEGSKSHAHRLRRGYLDAAAVSFRPVPAMTTAGESGSQLVGPLRLNPEFVEALMGWPVGWSLPVPRPTRSPSSPSRGPTGSGSSETASCPSRQQPPLFSSCDD